MELSLDIFKNDAFSVARLRRVVTNVPFVPQALGQMNLFTPRPIDTEFVILYEDRGQVRLIPMTDRGAPDIQAERTKGLFRAFKVRRLSKKDTVRASELLGVANTALPETIRLRTAAQLVNDRMGQLRTDMAATFELHRLGALQGKLLDADGTTVLYDYFTEFGIAPPVVIDVDFAGLSEADFMMFFQENFYRPMMRVLKDRKMPGMSMGALVGDTFWAKLMTHPGFREIYKLEMQARAISRATNPLVQPNAWMEVDFGGIRWINYMGTDDGTTIAIPADEARFFPIGARDVFDVYFAPGETLDTVTGLGQELYPIIRPDVRAQPEFIEFFLRSYPLHICIFPQALRRARVKP